MTPLALLLVTIAAWAPPAEAAGLRLHRLARTGAPPVASAKSGGLAYLLSTSSLRVRRTGAPARAYDIPPGCRPVDMAAGAVALRCKVDVLPTPTSTPFFVLRESDGVIVPVQRPPDLVYGGVEQFGSRWMIVDGNRLGDDGRVSRRFLVEWATGRVIEIAGYFGGGGDPFASDHYVNPDAADPVRRLCAPVRRTLSYAPVTRIGRWVAVTQGDDGQWHAYRCGTRRDLHSPNWSSSVLGRDALGYRVFRRKLVYRDLRSGARLTGPWPDDRIPTLSMYGRRLVVVVVSINLHGQATSPYSVYLGPEGA